MRATSQGPRLLRGEDSTVKLWAVQLPGCSHRSQLVSPQHFSAFFPVLCKGARRNPRENNAQRNNPSELSIRECGKSTQRER